MPTQEISIFPPHICQARKYQTCLLEKVRKCGASRCGDLSVTCTDMQRLMDRTDGRRAREGEAARRQRARRMQNLFKAKRTEICPRLILHAGNVTGDLCLLSSRSFFHPQGGMAGGLVFDSNTSRKITPHDQGIIGVIGPE